MVIPLTLLLATGVAQVQAQDEYAQRADEQDTSVVETGMEDFDMSNMYRAIIEGAVDAQLNYYESSDAVVRRAKLTKAYYDALREAGFTEEQAFTLIIEQPLVTVSSSPGD